MPAAEQLPILELDEGFWDHVTPARFPKHVLRFRNDRAAADIGLADLSAAAWEDAFARFVPLEGNLSCPLALRYHGHQFGVYNPHLGDGRGFLFAQIHGFDLGTKGSGTTPWSRGGDGRLTLKGGVREILASEMLEALGVPTMRSLSLFETGELLDRGDEPSPTRSSVLVRLGRSHIRFGTFQRLARLRDSRRMTMLVDHVVRTYYPELEAHEGDARVVALLDRVVAKSADLCASWMAAGFCHGVLNTDNMTITGESFDYGPWRFVPWWDRDFVAAYFDHGALYAFGRQPATVEWNLMRLAEALQLVTPHTLLANTVVDFEDRYEEALTRRVLARMGRSPGDPIEDDALVRETIAHLEATKSRLPGPTLLIDEVEAIWKSIADDDDWGPFEAKISEIRGLEHMISP